MSRARGPWTSVQTQHPRGDLRVATEATTKVGTSVHAAVNAWSGVRELLAPDESIVHDRPERGPAPPTAGSAAMVAAAVRPPPTPGDGRLALEVACTLAKADRCALGVGDGRLTMGRGEHLRFHAPGPPNEALAMGNKT